MWRGRSCGGRSARASRRRWLRKTHSRDSPRGGWRAPPARCISGSPRRASGFRLASAPRSSRSATRFGLPSPEIGAPPSSASGSNRGAPAYWCSAAARGPARLTTQSPRRWSAACWAMRTSCGARAPRTRPRSRYAVPGRVVVRGFFDPMTEPYRAADLVVSRAGAMTVAELCAWGKPSILVPLPTAAADHQTHNARALAAAGAAIHLAERELSAHSLAQSITELLDAPARLASLAAHARGRGHPDASREIVSRILTLVR